MEWVSNPMPMTSHDLTIKLMAFTTLFGTTLSLSHTHSAGHWRLMQKMPGQEFLMKFLLIFRVNSPMTLANGPRQRVNSNTSHLLPSPSFLLSFFLLVGRFYEESFYCPVMESNKKTFQIIQSRKKIGKSRWTIKLNKHQKWRFSFLLPFSSAVWNVWLKLERV